MISEAWLDMYHRARSTGMTHAMVMSILVAPSELPERLSTPDPYRKFRDAIRDGKRVLAFQDWGRGKFYAVCKDVTSFYPEQLMIEGEDIPVMPTQEWLDEYGVELNGECRVPNGKDTWVSFTNKSIHWPLAQFTVMKLSIGTYSGRRWIVKRKQSGPRTAFDNWIDALPSETLKNVLNADSCARCIVHDLFKQAGP